MPRPLTSTERAVLTKLIEDAGSPDELCEQLARAEFGEPWFEGSQSFSLVVPDDAPRYYGGTTTAGSTSIVASASVYLNGTGRDNDYIGGFHLWADNGLIDEFEYAWVTEEMPDSLPRLEDIVI